MLQSRAFKYITPKLRLDHNDLNRGLLLSNSFHLICSPKRCVELVTGILTRRSGLQGENISQAPKTPLFVWEPVPDLCVPEELSNCCEALRYVDIVSPNHIELASFFGQDGLQSHDGEVNHERVEGDSLKLLNSGIGCEGRGAVVVRAGKAGCYLLSRAASRWFPAYHQPDQNVGTPSKVVDPTGGGNAFLGGLAIALARQGDQPGLQYLEEAVLWGSVAASFAIEQVGMPSLARDGGGETWNGIKVEERLNNFKARLQETIENKQSTK